MENTFYLEIITPDRQFYTGPATNLTMPALDWLMSRLHAVQPGHEPVVTALRPGTVRFQTDGTPHEVVVSDGFAEIMPDYCILLVSSAERPDEIDRARAERAKERAEERLRQKQSIREYHLSKAALARAMALTSTSKRNRLEQFVAAFADSCSRMTGEQVHGLYLYRVIYNLGTMNLRISASWFASATLIILALPLGLIFARIMTDKRFRYCT